MCGLYCRFGSIKGEEVNSLKKLVHRGPDFVDYFEKKNVFMGHARLSILDLTSQSNQPYKYKETTLVFNGEIYNYKELRERYYPDELFSTKSDTEVLSRLLYDQGEKILPLLNGMFAFVYYDERERTVLVGRDSVGIKPLYMYKGNDFLELASEIKCFDTSTFDEKAKSFILNRCYQLGELPYKSVYEIISGSYAKFDICNLSPEIHVYSSLLSKIKKSDSTESVLVNKLDDLIQESVNIHLRSDANVGALCSGGIDSSLISSIAVKLNKNVTLYHAGVEGRGGEEEYAELVSNYIGHEIVYEKMDREKFWKDFSYVTHISDLPIYHPNDLALNLIAKKVKEDQVKVLLSGEGADEMFAGYSWHRKMIKQRLIDILADKCRVLDMLIRRAKFKILPMLWSGNRNDYLRINPLSVGYSSGNLLNIIKSHGFVKSDFKSYKLFQEIYSSYLKSGYDDHDAYALSVIHNDMYGHLGTILHRTDRILMANSIEGRVPFLENSLMNFSMTLPVEKKISNNQGKYLLKKVAERYLPNKVIYRKKAGFPVPWPSYLTGVEAIFHGGYVLSLTGLKYEEIIDYINNDHSFLFMLISLEVWGRIFVDKESWESVSELIMDKVIS